MDKENRRIHCNPKYIGSLLDSGISDLPTNKVYPQSSKDTWYIVNKEKQVHH